LPIQDGACLQLRPADFARVQASLNSKKKARFEANMAKAARSEGKTPEPQLPENADAWDSLPKAKRGKKSACCHCRIL